MVAVSLVQPGGRLTEFLDEVKARKTVATRRGKAVTHLPAELLSEIRGEGP